jgi:hypothetical protein
MTHDHGSAIPVCAVVLSLCLIGLTSCSSSPGGGAGPEPSGVVGGGSGALPPSSPGCFTTAYVRGEHKSLTAKQPVLVSAQLPDPVIPDPDVYIDSERQTAEDQQSWANTGIDNAHSVAVEAPLQEGLEPTHANLVQESKGVVATEDSTLLTDDLSDLSTDPDYGDQMCKALDFLDTLISAGTINPNDPNAVADAVLSLKSSTDPYAPNDLASAIKDAYDKFQQAFPQCSSGLDTVKWIIEQIQNLFCGAG